MTMKQKQVNNEIDQSSSHDEKDLASFNDTERLTRKNPTPHERADLIVRRLENFIREGRTEDGGINLGSAAGVRGVPTVIIYKKGVEVDRKVCGVPESNMKEFLDKNI